MIRVFARKTSFTPTGDLAFYGEPPLFDLPNMPVMVSVTFTWDKMRGFQLRNEWNRRMPHQVSIGGPAFEHNEIYDGFVPGRFLKKGITITSRGCPKNCSYCLVPQREGKLREINIAPGHIIQDNNLLACSRGHIEKVFEMLAGQKKGAEFKGGLDIDFLKPWHVELLKGIKIAELWVACDRKEDIPRLDKARDLFSDFPIEKRRCYVLVGFEGDTPEAATRRCEKIYDQERGFLPFAQYYQPALAHRRVVPKKWRFTVWKWARPAAFRHRKDKAGTR